MDNEFSLVYPDFEDMADEVPTKGAVYTEIAKQIREISPDVVESLKRVFLELSKTDRWHTYLAAKKFVETSGFLIADSGYVGIGYQFVFDRIAPCDIVLYGTTESVKSGDIVLFFQVIEHGFKLNHYKIQRVYRDGRIDIEDEYKKQFTVPLACIIGKVLKVIPFGEPDWHEMIMEMINEQRLMVILNHALGFYGKQAKTDKTKLDELNRRIRVLKDKASG